MGETRVGHRPVLHESKGEPPRARHSMTRCDELTAPELPRSTCTYILRARIPFANSRQNAENKAHIRTVSRTYSYFDYMSTSFVQQYHTRHSSTKARGLSRNCYEINGLVLRNIFTLNVFLRLPALASQYPKVLSAEQVMMVGECGDQCSSRMAYFVGGTSRWKTSLLIMHGGS